LLFPDEKMGWKQKRSRLRKIGKIFFFNCG
jgi:hypothetical protein